MKDVRIIASYIAGRYQAEHGERIDEMKLHKLLYFAQRESLIRSGEPLFEGDFYGWRFGPVLADIREIYKNDDFAAEVSAADMEGAGEILDYVFDSYADKDSWSLSRLTHGEISWKKSRKGVAPSESSNNLIPLDDIRLDADRMRQRREMLDQYGLL
ncbi:MAG: DUF4065 domain-containing protein [Oscillospiraceae bacterium]|nr:DUF4065 domain-containing protein [Oscillospiraceae bacterium]